jgi:3-hydroxybutyrate dehydrogenase
MDVRAALVTGAASGIGRAIAQRLVRDGWNVLAVDIQADVDRVGTPHLADLTTRAGNYEAVTAAVEQFGRLDAVIANAGVQHVSPIEQFPEDRWDAIIALMLTSPFLLARAAWPHLKESGDGRFVAMASVHGLVASPYKAAYVSAKHGLMGLVKTLALEGGEHNISATAVCPGAVRTPLVEGQIPDLAHTYGLSQEDALEKVLLASQAIKRLIEPEDIAATVAFLLSKEGSSFTGVPLVMDQGWTAR